MKTQIVFDRKKAEEARKNIKIKRGDLADILTKDSKDQLARHHMCTLIYEAERNKNQFPRLAPGTKMQVYLLWLKEQGYNPYNL